MKKKPAKRPRKPAVDTRISRLRLRHFAEFIETQDAEALAAEVTNFRKTLYHCARIQVFFQNYVAALEARRPR